MIPLNYATKEHPGTYVLSGSFAEKAYKEAEHLGIGTIAASSKEGGYKHIPTQEELAIDHSLPMSISATTTRSTARSITTSRKRTASPSLPTCPRICSRVRLTSKNSTSFTLVSRRTSARPVSYSSSPGRACSRRARKLCRRCSVMIRSTRRIPSTTRRRLSASTWSARSLPGSSLRRP